jgi:hypothetical protein
MGGDCSQKLCPGGESQSSPGRRSSAQYENNSIAKIGCPWTRLSDVLFFPASGGAAVGPRPCFFFLASSPVLRPVSEHCLLSKPVPFGRRPVNRH